MPLIKDTLKSGLVTAWSSMSATKLEGATKIASAYKVYAMLAQDHQGNPVVDVFTDHLRDKIVGLQDNGTAEAAAAAIAEGIIESWTDVIFTCPNGTSKVLKLPEKDPLKDDLLNSWLSQTGEVAPMAELAAAAMHKGTKTIVTEVTITNPPPPVITEGLIQ